MGGASVPSPQSEMEPGLQGNEGLLVTGGL